MFAAVPEEKTLLASILKLINELYSKNTLIMRLIDSSTTAHTLMSLSAAKNREVNDRKNQ